MKISILAVQTTTQTSKAGKPYQQLEVTFKNLTFGKVESKKLMPFGENKNAFDALANAKAGDVFEVTVVKNTAGYNDWPTVVQAPPGADAAAQSAGNISGKPVQVKSTYETPEERAKKQIYIIKQSSLSSAVATLSVGAKSVPSTDAVLALASTYFNWVMQDDSQLLKQDILSMPSDDFDVE